MLSISVLLQVEGDRGSDAEPGNPNPTARDAPACPETHRGGDVPGRRSTPRPTSPGIALDTGAGPLYWAPSTSASAWTGFWADSMAKLARLSDNSPLPLREQLVQQVRELVLSGTLEEHFRLPSIRALAREQGVGVVTVQRVFEDLEREGMIYARQGKGYFVAPIDDERRRDLARGQATSRLERPVAEARGMGLGDEEIVELVRDLLGSTPGEAP